MTRGPTSQIFTKIAFRVLGVVPTMKDLWLALCYQDSHGPEEGAGAEGRRINHGLARGGDLHQKQCV